MLKSPENCMDQTAKLLKYQSLLKPDIITALPKGSN